MNATAAPLTPGTIIAGRFDTFDQAEDARDRLEVAGFPRSSISVFFNNPPGRHDLTEVGGDEHADPQAHHAAGGAIACADSSRSCGSRGIGASPPSVAPRAPASGAVRPGTRGRAGRWRPALMAAPPASNGARRPAPGAHR
ncbi:MAG TPA: hypothetical protein VNB03_14550 [Casimicrobiaceae bacterium]|nr:hypothetical protein [Casimicrobiaceae bacterium]